MFKIRTEQVEVFEKGQLLRFEQEAIEHVYRYWPDQAAEQGEDGVRESVARAFEDCEAYGIELEADVLRYLNLTYALGPGFASERAWAREMLEEEGRSGTQRVDALCERAVAILDAEESKR